MPVHGIVAGAAVHDGRSGGEVKSLIEAGAINVSCAMGEEGVMHQQWLIWMVVDDEEGSERKTKEYSLFRWADEGD